MKLWIALWTFILCGEGHTAQVVELNSSQTVVSAFLLPDEQLMIEGTTITSAKRVEDTDRPKLVDGIWKWTAPQKNGHYRLEFKRKDLPTATVQAFVLVPFKSIQNGKLNGYAIGQYPNSIRYPKPMGFVEVTEKNRQLRVSDSFRLSQFLCKQAGGFPKYLVLRPKLLKKLEGILTMARTRGRTWTTLFIMSGYRTPHYNRGLKNVRFSRHIYGQAVDIFVDHSPRNNWMDDVNQDGSIDVKDAHHLYDFALRVAKLDPTLRGGLGAYRRKPSRGPFLHVDVRGYPARWGVAR